MEAREDSADLVEVVGEISCANDDCVIDIHKDKGEVLEELGETGLKILLAMVAPIGRTLHL